LAQPIVVLSEWILLGFAEEIMDFVLSEWILLGFVDLILAQPRNLVGFVDLILAQPRNLVGFVGFCRGKKGSSNCCVGKPRRFLELSELGAGAV
jgi:hypothetical protein